METLLEIHAETTAGIVKELAEEALVQRGKLGCGAPRRAASVPSATAQSSHSRRLLMGNLLVDFTVSAALRP